jgi:hypothetical protein
MIGKEKLKQKQKQSKSIRTIIQNRKFHNQDKGRLLQQAASIELNIIDGNNDASLV